MGAATPYLAARIHQGFFSGVDNRREVVNGVRPAEETRHSDGPGGDVRRVRRSFNAPDVLITPLAFFDHLHAKFAFGHEFKRLADIQ